ncbi:DUF3892 domain-containing protein [Paraburkholderia fynbosensis]|uniref:DUF3892 domain-containing protein n=1 Tax=Paraburkholderia fynbosensis TaxID=1200993 RepID=UPI0015841A88|nr:DUF3892 domain-containing protein [Paraburkholderia fynbosensis]
MTARHRVLCINKIDRGNRHEQISYIGGMNADKSRWRIAQANAIEGIESGRWAFYVVVGNITAEVVVSTSVEGRKYLKTNRDSSIVDNLLSLPECP